MMSSHTFVFVILIKSFPIHIFESNFAGQYSDMHAVTYWDIEGNYPKKAELVFQRLPRGVAEMRFLLTF